MIDVKRQTCAAGDTTVFQMKNEAGSYLIKNFTSASVLVCLGDEWNEDESVMVAAQTAEIVESEFRALRTDTVLVQASADGTVEVIRND